MNDMKSPADHDAPKSVPSSDSESDADSLDDTLTLRGGGMEKKPCTDVEASFKSVLARLAVERRHQHSACNKESIRHGTDIRTKVYPTSQKVAREQSKNPHEEVLQRNDFALELEVAHADQGLEREEAMELKPANPVCNKKETIWMVPGKKYSTNQSENEEDSITHIERSTSCDIYQNDFHDDVKISEQGRDSSYTMTQSNGCVHNTLLGKEINSDNDISALIFSSGSQYESSEADVNVGCKRIESDLDMGTLTTSSNRNDNTKGLVLKPSDISTISLHKAQALDGDYKEETFSRNRTVRCWAYLICIALAILLVVVLIPTTLCRKKGQGVRGSNVAATNMSDDSSSQIDTPEPSESSQPIESTTAIPTSMPSISNIFSLAPPLSISQASTPPTKASTNITFLNDISTPPAGTIVSHEIQEGLELIEVDNILSMVQQPFESSYGCHDTGPQAGGSNLFDNVISDFMCPPPQHGDSLYGVHDILPTFVFDAGSSIVTGIRVFAATNCFRCDPISYNIQGYSNSSWKLIASGPFDDAWAKAGMEGPPPERNPKFASTLGSSTHCRLSSGFVDFSTFENFVPVIYSRYRLQFPDLRYGSNPYNLWLGELQLVGALVS